MAGTDSMRGLRAEITLSGNAVQKYFDPEASDTASHMLSKCIAAASEQAFEITITSTSELSQTVGCIKVEVMLDGESFYWD